MRGGAAALASPLISAAIEAELGREGIRRVVETPLTDGEKALLVEAYEAVKAKQADVKDL